MNSSTVLQKTIYLMADSKESSTEVIELLKSQNFGIIHEVNRQNVRSLIINRAPDLVLLDFICPSIDELETCRDIRSKFRGPIVILSNSYSDMHHIQALAYGADDFIGKPFNPLLFVAKINSLLRRVSMLKEKKSTIFRFGELTVDVSRREVIFRGKYIKLTSIEFEILDFLVNNAGRVVSRNDIHFALYGTEYNGYDRSIDSYISRIRQKIGDDPDTPKYLKTVRGAGYLFMEA